MQSYIDCCFGSCITRTEAVDVCQDIFQPERIAKLLQIDFPQKCHYGIHRLTQIGRHRGFAVSGHPFVLYLHLYIGSRSARIRSYGKHMLQLKLVRKKSHFHPASLTEFIDREKSRTRFSGKHIMNT